MVSIINNTVRRRVQRLGELVSVYHPSVLYRIIRLGYTPDSQCYVNKNTKQKTDPYSSYGASFYVTETVCLISPDTNTHSKDVKAKLYSPLWYLKDGPALQSAALYSLVKYWQEIDAFKSDCVVASRPLNGSEMGRWGRAIWPILSQYRPFHISIR